MNIEEELKETAFRISKEVRDEAEETNLAFHNETLNFVNFMRILTEADAELYSTGGLVLKPSKAKLRYAEKELRRLQKAMKEIRELEFKTEHIMAHIDKMLNTQANVLRRLREELEF